MPKSGTFNKYSLIMLDLKVNHAYFFLYYQQDLVKYNDSLYYILLWN